MSENREKPVGGDVTPGARDGIGGDVEGDVWLTYKELAARLGITVLSAQRRVQRAGWRRRLSNYGIARVAVPHHVLHPVREDVTPGTLPDITPDIIPDAAPDTREDSATVSRLLDRVESLENTLETVRQDHAAERDEWARERVEVAGKIARVEAEREAAEVARRALEAAATRAERRQDALEEELRQARRPLWERVVQAVRGRG